MKRAVAAYCAVMVIVLGAVTLLPCCETRSQGQGKERTAAILLTKEGAEQLKTRIATTSRNVER